MSVLTAIRRGIATDEAQFFWTLGRWDISAGFFAGFGLGVCGRTDEWDATLGPFSIGGVRRPK